MISFKGVCYIQMVSQDIAAGKRGTYIGKFRILFKNPLTSEQDTIVGGDTYKDVWSLFHPVNLIIGVVMLTTVK